MNNIEKAGGFGSLPSMFDILVAGIFGITFLPSTFLRGTFFVFYSLFIICVTLFLKPKRQYTSIPLALLTLWSFAMIFVHNNITVVNNSIVNRYFNIAIMYEGFIYLFVGVLLFRSIIIYSKQPMWILLCLPISIIPLIKDSLYMGSMSMIAAIVVSCIIYLFINRRMVWVNILMLLSVITSVIIWKWIALKFVCRPYAWVELLRNIKEHPFVGSGFNHTLLPDNMIWVKKIGTVTYGWIWAHNDYLNLASYLGVITLIFMAWFITETLKRIGKTVYLIPFLTIVIASCFQITMFFPDKAAICIVVAAVCITKTYKGEVA